MPDEYDLFVSYKSQNANEVRRVVECLIAAGTRVWFAEYHVLTGNFERFQEEIDRGIDRSRYALVFTNDRWADSRYCALEMQRILPHLGRSRILEVCIPRQDGPYRRYGALDGVPSIAWRGDPHEIVDFVRGHIALPAADTAMPAPATGGRRVPLRFGASLTTGPLARTDAPPMHIFHERARETFPGERAHFRGTVDGHDVLLTADINPWRTVVGNPSVSVQAAEDDRVLYEAYLHYANRWLGGEGYRDLGLHLLWLEERTHLGLSYVEPGRAGWHRRYTITLDGAARGEVGLDFGVVLPPGEEAEQLRAFARLAGHMESIAASFRYEPRPIDTRIETVRQALGALVPAALAFLLQDYARTQLLPVAVRGTALLLFGVFAMSVIAILIVPAAREAAMQRGLQYGVKSRLLPTHGRALNRAWDAVVGAVLWSARTTAAGSLALVAGIVVGWIVGPANPWYWALVGFAACLAGLLASLQTPESREPTREAAR
jgi:hypothetical protein